MREPRCPGLNIRDKSYVTQAAQAHHLQEYNL